jgi:hypothetical protein
VEFVCEQAREDNSEAGGSVDAELFQQFTPQHASITPHNIWK